MDQGHLGREGRRAAPAFLQGHGRRAASPGAAEEDVGGVRGGRAAGDGRRTCLIWATRKSARGCRRLTSLSPTARGRDRRGALAAPRRPLARADGGRRVAGGGRRAWRSPSSRDGDVLARHMAPLRQAHAPPPHHAGRADRTRCSPISGRICATPRACSAQAARLRGRGRPDARARDRRHDGDLQRGLRRAAEAAALSRARAAGEPAARRTRRRFETTARPPTSPIATTSGRSRTIGAWDAKDVSITGRGDPEQDRSAVVSATARCRCWACSRRLAGSSPKTTSRRAARCACCPDPWLLAAPVRRRRRRHRPAARTSTAHRPRSSACCRRRSSSCARSPRWCCRCSSTARRTRPSFDFQALARLKPGVTLAQANADMARMIPLLPQNVQRVPSCSRTCGRSPTT